jgi:hypothetical protein
MVQNNLESKKTRKGWKQILVPQLRSTTVESGGEQTSIRAYNVITWNFFIALKAHPI